MVTRARLRYTRDYLMPGICSLIKPGAMEILMPFPTKHPPGHVVISKCQLKKIFHIQRWKYCLYPKTKEMLYVLVSSLNKHVVWLGSIFHTYGICFDIVDVFIHILQGYFIRTGTIVWLLHCQWNNCERYRWTRPVSNHDKLRGKREVPKEPINNTPALVQKMAWRRPGDKPLSEPMLLCFTDAYIRHSASNHNKP